jgi:polyisoprenoid-binding protein YceI
MTTAQVKTSIPTGIWKSDPVHSHAGFEVKHTAATFRGDFRDFEATLVNEDGEPRLSGAVKVESVDVRDENLSAHLLSPDFFDAERYPQLGFESTAVRIEGDEIVIEGTLSLKGHEQTVAARGQISGPAVGPDGSERIGLDLETKVDRTQYGLEWNAELPDGGQVLGDEVTISVHLELVKES